MRKLVLLIVILGSLCRAGAAETTAAAQASDAGNANSASSQSGDLYKVAAGDRLLFRVEEDPSRQKDAIELLVYQGGETEFPVSRDDRSIAIPLKVVGKTLAQIKAELKTALEADYYRKATVKLSVPDPFQQRGQVAFWGAVRGVLQLDPAKPMTVSDAILRLGWDQMFANLKKVEVSRTDPVTKQKKTLIVNVQAILDKDGKAKDVILEDGDRVHVPDKGIILN